MENKNTNHFFGDTLQPHRTKNTLGMNVKSDSQNILFLFCTVLIAVITSCNNRSQSDQKNQIGKANTYNNRSQAEKKNQGVQTKTESKLLKYTTGIRSILEDSKGNIWFGSGNEGVCLLHHGEFQYFTTQNGLSDNQVRNIYEDGNGMIWFECGKGLSVYNGQKISVYKERNYDSTKQWKLVDKDIWLKGDEVIGYNKLEKYPGVYQYDGQKLFYRSLPVSPKSGEENIYSITTPFVKSKNGTLWLGTFDAVIGYNGSDFKVIDDAYLGFSKGMRSLHVRSIMEDSKGNLWIGNNGIGVLKYDGKKIIDFTDQQGLKKEHTQGNSLERVFSIGEDASGNIWFGTVESGVWRYDGYSVKNFTEKDGLEAKHIWTIYKSKQGELWFGGDTPSGVYRFVYGNAFERIY